MNDRYAEVATPESVAGAAAEVGAGADDVLAVLIAETDRPDLDQVVRALRRVDVPFFGGVFPGVVHGGRAHDRGAVVVRMPSHHAPALVTGLDREDFVVPHLDGQARRDPGSQTAIVLIDGLAANVSRFLSEMFSRLGNRVNYIGGGAGTLDLVQRPCVFTAEGVYQDAAVVAVVDQRSTLGVRHGWSRLEGPIVATRASGNRIQELNWRNAFEVYRDALADHVDDEITRENLFDITKSFPFGIHREGQEDVVRDPVAVGDDGELVCVGEVPENAVLNVMRGDHESLLAAAAQAAEESLPADAGNLRSALLVDCVSRTIFLGDRFDDELAVVRERIARLDPDLPLWGILSLGEISSHGSGYVDFFNKTIVSAVLHDGRE